MTDFLSKFKIIRQIFTKNIRPFILKNDILTL